MELSGEFSFSHMVNIRSASSRSPHSRPFCTRSRFAPKSPQRKSSPWTFPFPLGYSVFPFFSPLSRYTSAHPRDDVFHSSLSLSLLSYTYPPIPLSIPVRHPLSTLPLAFYALSRPFSSTLLHPVVDLARIPRPIEFQLVVTPQLYAFTPSPEFRKSVRPSVRPIARIRSTVFSYTLSPLPALATLLSRYGSRVTDLSHVDDRQTDRQTRRTADTRESFDDNLRAVCANPRFALTHCEVCPPLAGDSSLSTTEIVPRSVAVYRRCAGTLFRRVVDNYY